MKNGRRNQAGINFLGLLISILLLFITAGLSHPDLALAQTSINQSSFNFQEILRNTLLWINDLGTVGAVAYICIYIVATVAFLPASILTLGSGVIFGVVWGSLYVFIGAIIGATVAFLMGRYVARGWIENKLSGKKNFAAIDQAVGREGLKIILLMRLSPIFPFSLLNYALGITRVTFKDYFIGFVGMIPGTILYVYIGSLVGNIALIGTQTQPSNPTLDWIIKIMGLVTTVAVSLFIAHVAKKALEEEVL
jgi:uncharacterized membrane protein YdjX (TVP38/TMEM64 family)